MTHAPRIAPCLTAGAILLAALAAAGCAEQTAGPDAPAAKPEPQPIRFTGRVLDREGPCHTVRSFSTGRMYSVRPADLGEIPKQSVVRLKGVFIGRSNCPHPMITVEDLQVQ